MAPWQQSSAQGAPAPSVRLQKHGGIFSSVNPADWMRHWRYPNHLMLAVPWPVFFALIAVGYLLLHLVFTGLYWLDPHGISGVAGPNQFHGSLLLQRAHPGVDRLWSASSQQPLHESDCHRRVTGGVDS
jgi:hypothetical protein